jgi:hypothetical protein
MNTDAMEPQQCAAEIEESKFGTAKDIAAHSITFL